MSARFSIQPPLRDIDGAFVTFFPSGFKPDAQEEEDEECNFKVFRGKAKGKNHMIVVGETTAVDFVGKNFDFRKQDNFGEETIPESCQYALALYDKEAGTIQFAPVAGKRIIRMDARVRGMNYDAPDYEADPNADTFEGKMKINSGLLQNFSSAKRQRTVAKMTSEKRVAPEAIERPEALTSSLAAAVKDELTKEQVSAKAGEHRNIPPNNPEATTAEEAYPLDRLCDPHVLDSLPWKYLLSAANKPKKRQELEEGGKVRAYVLSRLYKLSGVDKSLGKVRARALAYLQALLEFSCGPHDITGTWLSSRSSTPAAVLNHLTHRFAEPVEDDNRIKFRRPKQMRDLLLSYIAVTALIVEGFSLETTDLAAELRQDPLDLNKTFEMVGCNPIRRVGTTEAGSGIYRVQLLQQGADAEDKGERKRLTDVLPVIKMRLKAKGKK